MAVPLGWQAWSWSHRCEAGPGECHGLENTPGVQGVAESRTRLSKLHFIRKYQTAELNPLYFKITWKHSVKLRNFLLAQVWY